MKRNIPLILFLLVLNISCATSPTATPTIAPTPTTANVAIATATKVVLPTATSVQAATPTVAWTVTPPSTPTPFSTTIPTPIGGTMPDILVQLLFPFLAALGAGILVWAYSDSVIQKREKEFQSMIECAPRKYAERLGQLIRKGARGGQANARVNARAIVAARNDLRKSLVSVSSLMNSEIDTLGSQIDKLQFEEHSKPVSLRDDALIADNLKEVYETIQVLDAKWPTKEDEIEIELRKLLAEMGLPITVISPKIRLTPKRTNG